MFPCSPLRSGRFGLLFGIEALILPRVHMHVFLRTYMHAQAYMHVCTHMPPFVYYPTLVHSCSLLVLLLSPCVLQWDWTGRLVAMEWSMTEDLVCVLDDGSVVLHGIDGQHKRLFSMGQVSSKQDYKCSACNILRQHCTGIPAFELVCACNTKFASA